MLFTLEVIASSTFTITSIGRTTSIRALRPVVVLSLIVIRFTGIIRIIISQRAVLSWCRILRL